MKAWQYIGAGQPLTLREIAVPTVGPGEVGVDILAAGLCHSDVGFLEGTIPPEMFGGLPRTLGHEVAGRVAEVGEGVTSLEVGDLVALVMSASGPGVQLDGGYAPKGVYPAKMAVKVPAGVSAAAAAAATDAGRTALHNIRDVAGVTRGTRLGIVGLGGLGLIGVQVGIAVGAEVYAADPKQAAREVAAELGATLAVSDVSELAEHQLDTIVDFAGFDTTTSGALKAVRVGGTVVLVGLGASATTIDITDFALRGLTLKSSEVSDVEHLEATLDLIAQGKVTPTTAIIGLEEIGEGMERVERGEVTGRLVAVYGE